GAVVVVAGDVAGVAVGDLAGGAAEDVPDRGAAAVFVDRAFDLIGGGGGAEQGVGGAARWDRRVRYLVGCAWDRAGGGWPAGRSEPVRLRRRRLTASMQTASTRMMPVAMFLVAADWPSKSSPFSTLSMTMAPRSAW